MFSYRLFSIIASIVLALSHNPVSASPYDHGKITAEDLATEKVYSPYVGRAYPDQVLFGDSHFHTNLSFDAGLSAPASQLTRVIDLQGVKRSSPIPVKRYSWCVLSIFSS
jgi:hypothetical protein